MITKNLNENFKTVKFDSDGKNRTQDYILGRVPDNGLLFDLLGTGGMHFKAMALGIDIISIDNGMDLGNKDYIKEMQKTHDNIKFMNFCDFCNRFKAGDKKVTTPWLDYCGSYSKKVRRDIQLLPKILADEGELYITLQEGHERSFPQGTDREVIREATIKIIEADLKKAGLIVQEIRRDPYTSTPKYDGRKKKNGTTMITLGFSFKKAINQ